MNKKNILIIGLGRVGQRFYCNYTWQYNGDFEVVGVIDENQDNPFIENLVDKGIVFFSNIDKALEQLGSNVDIVMDTTYCQNVIQKVHKILQEAGNKHTVVVSMIDYLQYKDEEQLISSVLRQNILAAS